MAPARPAAPPHGPAATGNRANPNNSRNNPHLGQWMENHQSLPLAEQQKALENEPGFRQLPPEQQQRQRDLLTKLNAMAPDQRQRYIWRTEAMERLTQPQRQMVRGAMGQLGSLPEERQRAVARIFRDVRNMPDAQRQQYLTNLQAHGQLNDQERATVDSLVSVNPYLPIDPPQRASTAPPQ